MVLVLLSDAGIHRVRYRTIFFRPFGANRGKNSTQSKTSASAGWSRAVDDGRWYDFSRRPLFNFYVYSAFLVDHVPQDVIRLISITSPVEQFARRRLDVLCAVHFADRRMPHVASLLRRPPKRILELGTVKGYQVGDYVYSCPLSEYQRNRVPVSRPVVYCRIWT